MTRIFIFQLGPVQPFIAAGRRTQDLYVGSRILSELAAAGWNAAAASPGFQAIFPVPLLNKTLPKGVPHRLSFVSNGAPDEVAEVVWTAVQNRWNAIADKVRDETEILIQGGEWVSLFNRQKQGWIEFYWVATPHDESRHGDSLRNANAALAQRKLFRHLPQVFEPGQKCTLTGSQQALNFDWMKLKAALGDTKDITFRPNERLGTVAYVKRMAQRMKSDLGVNLVRPPSTRYIAGLSDDKSSEDDPPGTRQEGYIAVLHMDGDHMGRTLSALESIAEHQEFSRKLSHFADEIVPKTVEKYGGIRNRSQLIYAGGDDVLALFPLALRPEELDNESKNRREGDPFIPSLHCARELRAQFEALTGCTASAGVAITPYDFPLDVALQMARDAEHIAKNEYGRDAIVVREANGTGSMREAGGKWTALDLVDKLFARFSDGSLSGKIGYDLLTVARELTGAVPAAARQAEVTRLLRRRTAEGIGELAREEIEALATQIVAIGDAGTAHAVGEVESPPLPSNRLAENWLSVAHWTILARFLAQPAQEVLT